MTRTLCGIFFGIVITREELKKFFKDDLDTLYQMRKKKSMKDLDDFLDNAKSLKRVQDKLFPEGVSLILSSDHYDCCDDRVDDMILGIEIKVVNIRKKRGPTSFDLSDNEKDQFTEFLLASDICRTPKFILRAPV